MRWRINGGGLQVKWRPRVRPGPTAARVCAAAVAAEYPPRIPVVFHQVADHVMTTFEGAFILSRLMKEPKLAAEQLVQCRNYLELLFTPVNEA